MPVNYGSLPFAEAIKFFRDKINLPTQKWDDLLGAAHDRAFVVAGATQADLLADLRAAVDKAIAQGTTYQEFKKDFEKIVAERGWTGWAGEDTKGGRAWRMRVIYDTNLFTSYAAGRTQQMKEAAAVRPYWRYRHSDASVTPRAEHLSWDGLVLRHDDPFWAAHTPPNGFNSLVPWEGVQGKVMMGLKAWYSGPIVEIIGDSGRRLCLTSYHPVLTDRGWMPAGQVSDGCNLLRYRFELDRTAEPTCPDHDHAPPRADELFNTLKAHGLCTVPGAAFNLYGDMRFIEGDIDVVGANRELLDGVQAEILQFIKQLNLVLPNNRPVNIAGLRRPLLARLDDFWQSISGAVTHRFHPLAKTCFTFTPHQHGAFIEFNPRLFQMRRQRFSANLKPGSQFAHCGARQIKINHLIGDGFAWLARTLPNSAAYLVQKLFAFIASLNPAYSEVPAQRCPPDTKPICNLLDRLPGLIGLRRLGNEFIRQNRDVPGAVSGRRPFTESHFEGDYFTAGPYRDARIYDAPSDCGGTNPQAHRDILKAHPGLIELDRVKSVSVRNFSGHVYDFQTKNGLIISLGGFCVSNCKCYIETLSDRNLEKEGLKVTPTADIPYSGTDPKTGLPQGVDKGWDYQPGAGVDTPLRQLVSNKLIAYPPAIAKALSADVNRRIIAQGTAADFAQRALEEKDLTDPLWLGFIENAERIASVIKQDLQGYMVLLPAQTPRHVDLSHGHDGQGQRPATPADYALVQPLLNEYDTIKLSTPSSKGMARFTVTKKVGAETFRAVFEVRPGKRNRAIALISLVIKTEKIGG